MITPTELRDIEKIGELGTEVEFTIEATPKSFRNLIGNLYPDKVRSIITELSANAADSHVKAGIPDRTFDVTLPQRFDPRFIVKDFGVGIPHEFMMDGYTRAFKSTKDQNNDENGSIGLGRLSALSLCDSYFCSSIVDGIKRDYTVFINERGLPTLSFLGKTKTNEGNGFTVEVPVPVNECDNFANKAKEVYRYYKTKPVITNYDNFEIPENKYVVVAEDGSFGLMGSSHKSVAIMGCYAYPFEASAIPNLTNLESGLLNSGLVVHFELGDLDIQTNRLGLHYNAPTIANIKKKLAHVADNVEKVIVEKFNGKDVFESIKLKGNLLTHNGSLYHIANVARQFLSKINVPDSLDFSNHGLDLFTFSYDEWKGKIRKGNPNRYSWDGDCVFYITKTKMNLRQKAVKIFEKDENKNKRIYFVKGEDAAFESFKTEYKFDLKVFDDAATLPFDKIIRAPSGNKRERKLWVFNHYYRRNQKACWDDIENELEDGDEIVYVQKKGYGLDDYYGGLRDLEYAKASLKEFCDDEVEIYGLTESQIKKFPSALGVTLIHLKDFINKKKQEYIKKQEEKISKFKYFNNNYSKFPVSLFRKLTLTLDHKEAYDIYNEYLELKEEIKGVKEVVASSCNVKVSEDYKYSTKQLFEKYPLLKLFNEDYAYRNDTSNEIVEDIFKYIESKNS